MIICKKNDGCIFVVALSLYCVCTRPGGSARFPFFYNGREREAIDEKIARVDGCKQSYLYSFATRGRSSMCLYGHGLKLGGVSGYRCRKNIAK